MNRYPLIFLVPAKTAEDVFVTEGVFRAIEARFCSVLLEKDSEEYNDLSRAYWSMAHIFDHEVQKKYENALCIQRSDSYEDRRDLTSDDNKKTV